MKIPMFRDCILLFLISVGLIFFIIPPDQTVVEGDLLIFFPTLYQLPWEGLWTPNLSGGTPRFVNPQLGFLYPPSWILAVDFHAYLPLYFLLHVLIAGIGIRTWLTEKKLQFPLLGMILYSCSGVMWGLLTKPDKLPGFAFLPWFLLGLTILFSKENRSKGWLLAVGAYSLSWFGGSVEGCVIMTLWGLGVALFHHEKWKSIGWLSAVGVCAVFIISINFIPLLAHLPMTTRGSGIEHNTDLSMAWVDLLRLVTPDDRYSPIVDIQKREHYLPSMYIGFSGLMLVVLGAVRSRNLLMLGMGMLFFVLALGENTPFYSLISYVPFLKTIQYPEKYWMGVMPAFAYWGAFGVQRAKIYMVALSVLGLECLMCSWCTFSIHNPNDVYKKPAIANTIHSMKKHPKSIPLFWDDTLQKTKRPMMKRGVPLYETIHASLYPNVGIEHGIGYVLGADRLRIKRHGLCVGSAIDAPTTLRHGLLRRMGASVFFTWRDEDTKELQENTSLRYLSDGLFIEELPTPFVFWSGSTLMANTMPPILSLMASPNQSVMVLTSDPQADSIPQIEQNAAPDQFGCSMQPEDAYYDCTWEAKEDGVIVLRQNWLPGWRATLDGSEHPVARVNAYMVGVYAPKGKHRLILEYRTTGLWFGGVLSLVGMMGAAFMAFRLSIGRAKRERESLEHIEHPKELETQA